MMAKHFLSILMATVVLSSLLSCTARPGIEAGSVEAMAPAILITSPENYASIQTAVNNRNITVEVSVRNFNLVEKAGQPNTVGEGHIHYFLDVNPPLNPGQPAVTAAGTWAHGTVTSHSWTNLPDGPHMLAAELVNNDETPLSPPVYDWVQTYLQFALLAPSVRIVSPKEGSNVSAGDVAVYVEIHNFIVVDRPGEPNLSGQGHLHYFIDADPPITAGKPAVTAEGTWVEALGGSFIWHNVNPGKHSFAVELVTNDHLPLYPPSLRPAYDKITVTVVPAG